MPKISRPFLLSLIFFAISASATAGQEEEYAGLCSYDDHCRLLKDGKSFVVPRVDIAEALKSHRDEIIATSEKIGVKPQAVAGAILADYTLTPNRDGGLAILSFLFNRSTAQVFDGQYINPKTALEAETHLALAENRPPKSEKEIIEELKTTSGAIYYTAAVMRQAQDTYQKYGFDISGDAGLLATLYNLGKYESRARTAKEKGTSPRVNFFGFFQRANAKEIGDILALDLAEGREATSSLDKKAPARAYESAGDQPKKSSLSAD